MLPYQLKRRVVNETNIIEVVSEYVQLKKAILDIDPNAFVNVVDSSEVMGEGFKPISA